MADTLMEASPDNRVSHRRGVRKEFRNLELDVWKWALSENKKSGKFPTKLAIQQHAQQKYQKAGFTNFKASPGWYRRWRKRYNLKGASVTTQKKSSSQVATTPLTGDGSSLKRNSGCPGAAFSSDGMCLSETLESFSLETDKLIGNIDMINSPSDFFNFSDSFDQSMDGADVCDQMKHTDPDNVCMKNFMKELIDDFGKYFSDSDKMGYNAGGKLSRKSCKYDKDFKNEVINFLTEHRIKEAAAKFSIHPNTISVWIKDDKFQNQLTEIIIEDASKKRKMDDVRTREKAFLTWLSEKDRNNMLVSQLEVKEKISGLFSTSWSEKSHWFAKYCHRYLLGKQSKPAKINYSDQFQQLIVKYASKTSQMKAASVFNLARKQLFYWMKNIRTKNVTDRKRAEDKLLQWYESKPLKPMGRTFRKTAKDIFDDVTDVKCSYSWYYKWCTKHGISVKRNCDEEIVEWILASYDQNLNVSHQDVQEKALEIYQSRNEGDFKASSGWLLRFCRRYMNLLRRTPPLSATLPSVCESNVENIRKHIFSTLAEYCIAEDCYGVMDEILLRLKPSALNKDNQKEPLLRSCGLSNIQGTVILSCLSNGVILPPILTLKDRNFTVDINRFTVMYQANGTVDDDVMLFWLDNIWFRYVKNPNLLLLDCFSPHMNAQVFQKFVENNSHLTIIPAGCSSKLNPLTQVISPQFQEHIDQNCRKWFEKNSLTWQIGGSGSSLSSQDIINWVGEAHTSISCKAMQKPQQELESVSGY